MVRTYFGPKTLEGAFRGRIGGGLVARAGRAWRGGRGEQEALDPPPVPPSPLFFFSRPHGPAGPAAVGRPRPAPARPGHGQTRSSPRFYWPGRLGRRSLVGRARPQNQRLRSLCGEGARARARARLPPSLSLLSFFPPPPSLPSTAGGYANKPGYDSEGKALSIKQAFWGYTPHATAFHLACVSWERGEEREGRAGERRESGGGRGLSPPFAFPLTPLPSAPLPTAGLASCAPLSPPLRPPP
jgi:hypothetical protein